MRKLLMILALVFFVSGLMLSAGCAPTTKVATDPGVPDTDEVKQLPDTKPVVTGETDAERQARLQREAAKRKAAEEERLRQLAAKRAREKAAAINVLVADLIYFDYNSAVLKPTAQSLLKRKAEVMKYYPEVNAIIEGHCDERGTNEYNLALGERRAESVKNFLVNLDVSAGRLTTISYGEERPAVVGHDEEAWSKNRRAAFLVE